eukprot:IDg13711t1
MFRCANGLVVRWLGFSMDALCNSCAVRQLRRAALVQSLRSRSKIVRNETIAQCRAVKNCGVVVHCAQLRIAYGIAVPIGDLFQAELPERVGRETGSECNCKTHATKWDQGRMVGASAKATLGE